MSDPTLRDCLNLIFSNVYVANTYEPKTQEALDRIEHAVEEAFAILDRSEPVRLAGWQREIDDPNHPDSDYRQPGASSFRDPGEPT